MMPSGPSATTAAGAPGVICHHHGPKKGVLHLIDPSHPQMRGSCALGDDTRDGAEDSRATGQ